MKRNRIMALLLCIVLLGQSACWFGGNGATATDAFASANYQISGLIGDAQIAILGTLKAHGIKPDVALAAAGIIQKANLIQQKELAELVKRLQPVGGKEQLVFTDGDKTFLIGIINSLGNIVPEVVNDPVILGLDSATRAIVTAAILAIQPLALQIISLLQKAPVQMPVAPALRQQLERTTTSAEQRRSKNDKLLIDIQAEVIR